MRTTRRLWAVLSLSALLALAAASFDQPLLLAGSVLIGAWVLAAQYSFLVAFKRTIDATSITQSPSRPVIRTDESSPVTLAAALDQPSSLHLDVEAGLPTAATAPVDSLRVDVPPGNPSTERTTRVRWPIAGRHEFDVPQVTATDGLFVATVAIGTRPAVAVEPRELRSIHVGEGGDRVASAYGEHESPHPGSGIEPAEIREYTPGDAINRIDWNVTARFSTPHIRENETKTSQPTLLVVDHRTSLATGPPNETKLDYLRETVLATAKRAYAFDDPIGLLGIGDDGITTTLEPTTAESYTTIRRELRELTPGPSAADRGAGPDQTRVNVVGSLHPRPTLRTIRRSASDLEHEADPFAETLYPFYADGQPYRQRIRSRPLFNAVRTTLAPTADTNRVFIFTDDTNPAELRETVSLTRRNGASVTIFLAPTALYDARDASDLQRTRNRYLEFEDFRRDLARMDRVRAFEVGPGDRLSAIIESEPPTGDRR